MFGHSFSYRQMETLQAQPFVIRTDHKSLLHLTEQKIHTKIQQKALLKLMDMNYSIQYKKGINNAATDSLSRKPVSVVLAISQCSPSWIEQLKSGYEDDEYTKRVLTELSLSATSDKGFQLQHGVLRYKGRVWVGNNQLAQQQQHIL